MIKVKSSSAKKHKHFLNLIKRSSFSYKKLNQKILKSLKYMLFMRKKNRHRHKKNWIIQINSFLNIFSLNYNQLMSFLKKKKIIINKKMLYQEIILNPLSYRAFIFLLIYKNKEL
jgi:ribosomal protein L20